MQGVLFVMPSVQNTSPNCGSTITGRLYENRKLYGMCPSVENDPAKALIIDEIWKRIKEKKGDRK